MKIALRIVTFVALWGLVGIIVVYVDPSLIRDTVVTGLYLPILIPIWLASVYTAAWIMGLKWFAFAIGTIVTTIIALLLVL